MAKVLTAVAVERLKPDPNRRREIPDAAVPGLYLQLQPSGRRSWAVRTRIGGKTAKITLRSLDLGRARDEARRIVEQAREGLDPRQERERLRAEAKRAELETVRAVCDDWLAKDQAGNRTVEEVRRTMELHVLPQIGDMPIAAVRKKDLIRVIDRVAAAAPVRANRVLAFVRRFFAWAAQRDLIDASPAQHVAKPATEQSRERVLSDAELAAIVKAARTMGGDFGQIVELLALTGQRRAEVGGMTWAELSDDLARWTLPGARTKNGRAHEIPLPTRARAVLADRPRIAERTDDGRDVEREHVFGTRGKIGFNTWSVGKARLDILAGVTGWTLHDLRRTAVTGMVEIGVAPHVVEAVVNHVSGHRGGVAGTYNRAEYRGEKATALQRWAEHVDALVSGRPAANVVPLRG